MAWRHAHAGTEARTFLRYPISIEIYPSRILTLAMTFVQAQKGIAPAFLAGAWEK